MDKTNKLPLPKGWSNAPKLEDLKQNIEDSRSFHDAHASDRKGYLDQLNITGAAKVKKRDGFSSVQPKLIRKHAEWRYAALSEAFLSNDSLYKLHPRTHADRPTSQQNEVVLNYQWNNVLNKVAFVDELVRTGVDEGTFFIRTGWVSESETYTEEVPIYEFYPANDPSQLRELQQAAQIQQQNPYAFKQHVPEHIQQALQLTEQNGQPIYPFLVRTEMVEKERLIRNHPTVQICPSDNCYPDPSCEGDLDKANFFGFSFETSKAELQAAGVYHNLDELSKSGNDTLLVPDHEVQTDSSFKFKDEPRKRIVAFEYWGYWDVDGSGKLTAIVATWVGSTLIRLAPNPYPDQKIPFVSGQYLPVRKSLYGEPDGALLVENQAIVGAVTRGAIDLLARSANGQEGIRQDALDSVNKRKYRNGENYEYSPSIGDPRAVMVQHTYPEIPNSVGLMLNMQHNEAESMTGVKPYAGGLSGKALGDTATAVRGVLDAATKRETGILRRFANAMCQVGRKLVAMNGEFLEEEEIIRITDEDFVAIRRENLKGNYDIEVTIATAEEDNTKAEELSFMLQTMGNTLPMEMSQIILSEIAIRRKMPDLAKRLQDYKPQPDPVEEQIKQMQLQKLQLENQKLMAEIQKIGSGIQLDNAKAQETMVRAGNLQSDTDQKNLDFLEQQQGIKHQRDMEQDKAQSEGNMALEILKAELAQQQPKVS